MTNPKQNAFYCIVCLALGMIIGALVNIALDTHEIRAMTRTQTCKALNSTDAQAFSYCLSDE